MHHACDWGAGRRSRYALFHSRVRLTVSQSSIWIEANVDPTLLNSRFYSEAHCSNLHSAQTPQNPLLPFSEGHSKSVSSSQPQLLLEALQARQDLAPRSLVLLSKFKL